MSRLMAEPQGLQAEYWNGPAAERWIGSREVLDRSLEPITSAALDLAAPRTGERVLDVGCGCGTTSAILRDRVSPGGAVVGVDISAPMVAVARERVSGVEFKVADAAREPLPAGFELIFSRFGVMFFADPVAAFGNLRRALVPGGRMVFVCWRALKENQWAMAPLTAVADLLPPAEPVDPEAPGPFAFADGDRLRRILAGAGFGEVTIIAHDDVMIVGETVDAAAEHALTIGPLSRAAGELADPIRREFRARIARALQPSLGPRGVTPAAATWLVRCTAG
jgi:SAM-dependent methyltransferase